MYESSGNLPMPEDVTIGDRVSFANQFLLRNVSNLRCSWEVSRIGLLSCDVPLADMPTAALPAQSLERKWITYQHPTAGAWGGVISSVSVRDGIVTLDCESWAAMLRGVVTWGITAAGMSGGLQQAINNLASYTGVTWGSFAWPSADEPDRYSAAEVMPGGSFFVNGQDLYNAFLPAVMDRLYDEHAWKASLRGLAWNIDPATRKFFLDMTYGRNLTQTVSLRDRVHNTASGWSDDVEDVVNNLLLTGTYGYTSHEITSFTDAQWIVTVPAYAGGNCIEWGKKKKGKPKPCIAWDSPIAEQGYWTNPQPIYSNVPRTATTTVQALNQASINRFGLLTTITSRASQFASLAEMKQWAQLIVAALSRNEQLVTIECADVGGVWAQFREGDIIGVDLGNSGRTGNMVARTRALDTTRGVMFVSGEAELI